MPERYHFRWGFVGVYLFLFLILNVEYSPGLLGMSASSWMAFVQRDTYNITISVSNVINYT